MSMERTAAPVMPVLSAARVERAGEALWLIRSGRARTIGELALTMNLARSTVVERVRHLAAAGLVVMNPVDDAAAKAARGRPTTVLRFNASGGVVLAAQLGITGGRVAVTDLDGSLLAEHFEPYGLEAGPEAVLGRLEDSMHAVLATAGRNRSEVRGIGIGVPRAIELSVADGVAASWSGFGFGERLEAAFSVPAYVDNDVNLLALGEQRSGWPSADVFLCVKAGSVIGCGTVVRGELVRGSQGVAGNIGHIAVPGNDTPCACGNTGCLDAVAGGQALVARLRAEGLAVRDIEHLVALAQQGVPQAAQAIRSAGRHLGEVLAYAVNLLNPGVVAVWGYLADAEAEFLAGVRETVYQRSLPSATRSLQLVPARLGRGAGLVGAAMMVVSNILDPAALDDYLTARAAGRHRDGEQQRQRRRGRL
jgi:predicted NBD/HSP70 family sugar kinase